MFICNAADDRLEDGDGFFAASCGTFVLGTCWTIRFNWVVLGTSSPSTRPASPAPSRLPTTTCVLSHSSGCSALSTCRRDSSRWRCCRDGTVSHCCQLSSVSFSPAAACGAISGRVTMGWRLWDIFTSGSTIPSTLWIPLTLWRNSSYWHKTSLTDQHQYLWWRALRVNCLRTAWLLRSWTTAMT